MTNDGDGPGDGSGPDDGGGGAGILIRWGPRLLFLVGAIVLTAQAARGVPQSELHWTLAFFALCSIIFIWRQLAQGNEMDAADSPPGLLIGAGAVLCAAGVTMLVVYLTHAHRNWLALIGAVVLLLGLGCFLAWRRAPQPSTWAVRLLIGAGTVLCTAGVTMLVLYWAGVAWDGLSLIGSVMLLLGLGCLVELWRQKSGKALLVPGAILLGIVGVTLVVVFFLLRGAQDGLPVGPLVALGVAVFVFLPLALNVLSERGLRALSTLQSGGGGGGGTVRLIGLAGVAFLILPAGYAVWLAYHDWVMSAILVGSVLLLLLAIVSNTHADVALVLAGLCVLAAAPPEHPALAQAGTKVLVAVGDSYMSGEGASSYFEGTDDIRGDHCRRAPSAYAVRIADQDERFDGIQFIACSGARTFHVIAHSDDGLAHPQEGVLDTQIDQLKKMGSSIHPALVIISIGGNDAGFATLGGACIAPGPCDTQRSLFEGNLDSVKDAVKATYVSLKKALPAGVPIVAVPYPQPIANADKCSGVALTKAERDFVRKFVADLNVKIDEATQEAQGIVYLREMEDTLADHHLQLCDRRKKEAGVNFVGLKSVSGPPAQRFNPANWLHNSLHPNERGHEAMLATFQDWLKENPKLLERAPASQKPGSSLPAPTRGAVAKPKPQCPLAVIDHTQSKCQLALSNWEVQQVTNRWLLLLTVLLCLLVAWAASIAIIGWLR
ncbi:GDSL-type esterase/lipase family protein [Streptomyces virginiae]|uniref:GDSL-type esterase/lipase family protein n=1 Tax=Streptomyces virginiae TaxID=1961 RepID=UPI002252FF19|nr:GDSL-type esterase/lipase family protein [Streptomyces virginiae]MCX5174198.1 GDSL-type esterase/lipase family protein [Streptomyces virginiae]